MAAWDQLNNDTLELLENAAPEVGGIVDDLVAAERECIDPELLEALDAQEDELFEGGDEVDAALELLESSDEVEAALELLENTAPEEVGGIVDELVAAERERIDPELLEALDVQEDELFEGGDETEAALEGNDEVEAALEGIDLVEAEHEANDQVETALKLLKIAAPEEGGGIIDKLVAAQSQHIDPEILEALDAEEDLLFEGGDEMEAAHEGNDEVEAALEGNDEVEAAHGGSDEPEAKE